MWLLDRVMTPLVMRVKALLGKVPGPTSAITLAQATACWVDLEEHPDTSVTRELANENLQADLTNTQMYNRNNRCINSKRFDCQQFFEILRQTLQTKWSEATREGTKEIQCECLTCTVCTTKYPPCTVSANTTPAAVCVPYRVAGWKKYSEAVVLWFLLDLPSVLRRKKM